MNGPDQYIRAVQLIERLADNGMSLPIVEVDYLFKMATLHLHAAHVAAVAMADEGWEEWMRACYPAALADLEETDAAHEEALSQTLNRVAGRIKCKRHEIAHPGTCDEFAIAMRLYGAKVSRETSPEKEGS